MKYAIITGATSGIGYETALNLASRKWNIGITYRNSEKGKSTIEKLKKESGNENIAGFLCDLKSFQSIKECTSKIAESFPYIDVLINNAGTWETKFTQTPDGIEEMFMVNFLAPVYLTKLLYPQLKKSGEARVINVSSAAHMMGKIVRTDPESRNNFKHIRAYGNSKLNLLLATKLLAREFAADKITINALHPGVVNTKLFDKFSGFLKWATRLMTISPEKGARTSIYLATEPKGGNVSGKYFAKSAIKKASSLAENTGNLVYIEGLLNKYLSNR